MDTRDVNWPLDPNAPKIQNAATETLMLTRFHPVRHYATKVQDADRLPAVFLDVETTGTDPLEDEIISIALVPFTFSREGIICTAGPALVQFEEPTKPITPEITRINGITDEMVKGREFSTDAIQALVFPSAIVVAHHAEFDRQFAEARFPGIFLDQRFGCSMSDVPWKEMGFESTKLEWLAFKKLGMFYDAHRPDTDCYVGIHLLASQIAPGRTGMACVLDAARKRYARLFAVGSPFSEKEKLKARGYRWNPGDNGQPKAWYIDVSEEAAEAERAWIASEARGNLVEHSFDARTRFSARIGK